MMIGEKEENDRGEDSERGGESGKEMRHTLNCSLDFRCGSDEFACYRLMPHGIRIVRLEPVNGNIALADDPID
jgi:hypothetical protein